MDNRLLSAVEELFVDYEDSSELKDLKEEIAINLQERVSELVDKGMKYEKAVEIALKELGDISEAANSISKQKHKELIGELYFNRKPLDRTHVIGYTVAGVIALFGIITAMIVGFHTGGIKESMSTLMVFILPPGCAFIYLGLTQETISSYAMKPKRALLYSLSGGLILTGFFLSALVIFNGVKWGDLPWNSIVEYKFMLLQANAVSVLGICLVFLLPALTLLCYLLLSEKDRYKPWVREQQLRWTQEYDERFGFSSGALWISAVAVFLLVGMLMKWSIAWIVFLFALAGQLLILRQHGRAK